MPKNELVDPRVRLAITQWPSDAPRGAVTTFCAEHGISRKTFYEIRRRSLADGPAAALEPRSRRPKSSPSKLADEVRQQAIGVRAALEQSGLDCGPISVHDKMHAMGLEVVPSVASLARIFRRRRRGAAGTEEETESRLAPVRLSGPERLLAARRHRVRTHPRPQVRDLPAHRRPLPLRSRLPRRLGRDLRSGDRRVRQGRDRPRRAPATAVRQRIRAQPVAARTPGPARRPPDGPGRRTDHRQTLQTHHPGQERTLPPDPVPLPRQTTTGRRPGQATGPGRRLRPHLQHPAPPPRTARPRHTPDRLASHREDRSPPPHP